MFLMQNKYPSLVNRILKVKMTPAFDRVNPVVGYSYQLREMLWHQFAVSNRCTTLFTWAFIYVCNNLVPGFFNYRPPNCKHPSSEALLTSVGVQFNNIFHTGLKKWRNFKPLCLKVLSMQRGCRDSATF